MGPQRTAPFQHGLLMEPLHHGLLMELQWENGAASAFLTSQMMARRIRRQAHLPVLPQTSMDSLMSMAMTGPISQVQSPPASRLLQRRAKSGLCCEQAVQHHARSVEAGLMVGTSRLRCSLRFRRQSCSTRGGGGIFKAYFHISERCLASPECVPSSVDDIKIDTVSPKPKRFRETEEERTALVLAARQSLFALLSATGP